jgi:electron transport complex protein RnfG
MAMKNTLSNMILVLGGISLVASAAVGFVYRVTAEPIRLAKEANTRAALSGVLPEFDETQSKSVQIDGMDIVVYTATKGDDVAGYAVETATQNGYAGEFRLMVGFTPGGEVYKVQVLEHSETPGLGSKMADEGNPLFVSFEGKNPSSMKLSVKKDGGDVDALTAATITSRAYVDAVARAYNALATITGAAEADAASGATATDGDSPRNEQGKEVTNE